VAESGGKDIELWPLYDAVTCPTLLLRGVDSDLLTHDTAVQMTRRGPQARLVEIPDAGHAPMLMEPVPGAADTGIFARLSRWWQGWCNAASKVLIAAFFAA
jgi:pimeloyl-ACP methyl ester carboxylesterase